jgi:hypothetical protein
MELAELIALKLEYERELALAQARVQVITDIISRVEAKERIAVVEEVENEPQSTTSIY